MDSALPLGRAVVIAGVCLSVLLMIISLACEGANLPKKAVWTGGADCFMLRKIWHSNPGIIQASVASPSAEAQPRADSEAVVEPLKQ